MTALTLTVNGRPIAADVAPRTHLADFLRDHLLLTGTHLGCEHGVCGACTLLLDDEPARSCIAYAAACQGAEIRTIEGLQDDPVMVRLRAAFTAAHALQCGYCTPGMLVTARDIVLRLPDATDDQVRLELAGNLCRCTGYNGIVRAIRAVLDERLDRPAPARAPLPSVHFGSAGPVASATPAAGQDGLRQRLAFAVSQDALWQALRDPALVASCIPGAALTTIDGGHIEGEMVVAVGPVRARFAGQAEIAYDDGEHSGRVEGGGADQASGTRLQASATFRVQPSGSGSVLEVDITFGLRGPLSQLAKGRVVDLLAGELASSFARTLAARLTGAVAPPPKPLPAIRLLLRVAWAWLRGARR